MGPAIELGKRQSYDTEGEHRRVSGWVCVQLEGDFTWDWNLPITFDLDHATYFNLVSWAGTPIAYDYSEYPGNGFGQDWVSLNLYNLCQLSASCHPAVHAQ